LKSVIFFYFINFFLKLKLKYVFIISAFEITI
jgi:hypothetical protein